MMFGMMFGTIVGIALFGMNENVNMNVARNIYMLNNFIFVDNFGC